MFYNTTGRSPFKARWFNRSLGPEGAYSIESDNGSLWLIFWNEFSWKWVLIVWCIFYITTSLIITKAIVVHCSSAVSNKRIKGLNRVESRYNRFLFSLFENYIVWRSTAFQKGATNLNNIVIFMKITTYHYLVLFAFIMYVTVIGSFEFNKNVILICYPQGKFCQP